MNFCSNDWSWGDTGLVEQLYIKLFIAFKLSFKVPKSVLQIFSSPPLTLIQVGPKIISILCSRSEWDIITGISYGGLTLRE